jgi:two-component system phosphate regulon response regulator PhoB
MGQREVLPRDGIQVFIPPAKLEPPAKKTDGMSVLIAEDDRDVRMVLHLVLRLDGHKVIEASTPKDALHRAAELRPDLIVLDLTFPGSEGFSALREMREADSTRDAPIIVISGRARAEDQIWALEGGADVYLVKPFDPLELMETVRNIPRMTREEREGQREKELDRLRQLARPAG